MCGAQLPLLQWSIDHYLGAPPLSNNKPTNPGGAGADRFCCVPSVELTFLNVQPLSPRQNSFPSSCIFAFPPPIAIHLDLSHCLYSLLNICYGFYSFSL